MKLQEFLDSVRSYGGNNLLKDRGVYNNQVILLNNPFEGVLASFSQRSYTGLKPIEEDGRITLGVTKSSGVIYFVNFMGENLTTYSIYPDERARMHSNEQVRRFKDHALIALSADFSTPEVCSRMIMEYLPEVLEVLTLNHKSFCIPRTLPEPVYYPDSLDDEIKKVVGGSR